jgi:hypothetical protein
MFTPTACTLSVLSEAGKRRDFVKTNGQALVSLLKQIPGTPPLATPLTRRPLVRRLTSLPCSQTSRPL